MRWFPAACQNNNGGAKAITDELTTSRSRRYLRDHDGIDKNDDGHGHHHQQGLTAHSTGSRGKLAAFYANPETMQKVADMYRKDFECV